MENLEIEISLCISALEFAVNFFGFSTYSIIKERLRLCGVEDMGVDFYSCLVIDMINGSGLSC